MKYFNLVFVLLIVGISLIFLIYISSQEKPNIKKDNQDNITLLSFGDAVFDKKRENFLDRDIDYFKYIKSAQENFLEDINYISLNLEGPITDAKKCKDNGLKFDPKIAGLLSENNINIVNLANNRIFDCYEQGIEDTKKNLNASGVDYFGEVDLNNSYIIKEMNNKKIVFLGIDQTIVNIDMDSFYSLINKLKENNDYVIVNIHWGNMYDPSYSETQRQIAYNLIDSGADVIIGHHPHVIQSIEVYKDKVIFYSLGNFISNILEEGANQGLGVKIVFNQDKYLFYLFPYDLIFFKPKLFSYDESILFCNEFLKDVINSEGCSFIFPNN